MTQKGVLKLLPPSGRVKKAGETKRVNIVNSYISVYQPLTPFLPSYSDKNLISPLKFCIFAPAIEGTAYCAENRSSIKTGAGLK